MAKKGWIWGCGIAAFVGVLACGGVIFLFVWSLLRFTQPVVDCSQEFLTLLGQDKIAEAYASTADQYRANQDEASFAAAVKQVGLTDFSSANWNRRGITNNQGHATGTVTTKTGAAKPIAINCLYEDGKWKVSAVQYDGVDLASIRVPLSVPDEPKLEALTLETLLGLNQAIQKNDFREFHGSVADVWKKQTTPEALQAAFQEFVQKKIDFAAIKTLKPRFDPAPAVNENRVLVLKGLYPTEPLPVRFDLSYVQERGAWKLISVSVNVRN